MEQARKLATIMAVDIAGYSRSTERDEAAAVHSVGQLKLALSELAARHGGRIFNTAGDGVMLEFPTASAGLATARAIMLRTDLPCARIGLHLGEVVVAGDDLLGHGVNVAARLQALADPGAAAISQGMSAQVHEDADFSLTPCGRVRLDKMVETINVFAYAPRRHRTSPRLRWRRFRPVLLAAIVLALVGLVAALVLGYRLQSQSASLSDSPTIAVLPFTSLNTDVDSRNLADTISVSIASALTEAGLTVVSQTASSSYRGATRVNAARDLGARYIVDGEVRQDGGLIRVILRIDDGRSGVTLISDTIECSVEDAGGLADQVAARIASLGWAFGQRVPSQASPAATESYFRFTRLWERGEYAAAFEGSRTFARSHPNEALSLHQFAVLAGYAYPDIPIAELPEAMLEAQAADRRARQLAPTFGEGYIAANLLMPTHRWAAREMQLRRGMEVDANGPTLSLFLGQIYTHVGRTREAEVLLRASAARDPFNQFKARSLIAVLSELGASAQAETAVERATRLWPDHGDLDRARFRSSRFSGRPSEVELLMRDPAIAHAIEPPGAVPVVAPMLRALASRRGGDVTAAAAACASGEMNAQGDLTCLVGLSLLNRLDQAFELTDRLYPEQRAATPALEDQMWLHRELPPMRPPSWLFKADLARLRADPRFIPLARRIGLFDYWRTTRHLPDFCSAESAPICISASQP